MIAIILAILNIFSGLLLFAAACFVVWLFYLIAAPGLLNGPPFVGSNDEAMRAISELAALRPGETVVDLGSGDGRVLAAAARSGCKAVGYEINPFLVLWSRTVLWRLGLADRASVRLGDFWHADIRTADVVIVYGFSTIMARFERKFEGELKPGSRVVSSFYRLPTWRPSRGSGRVTLYVKG